MKVTYNTSLPVIFGVKKYADALWHVCQTRDIHVNLRTNLTKVNAETNEATFQNLDEPEKVVVEKVRSESFISLKLFSKNRFKNS